MKITHKHVCETIIDELNEMINDFHDRAASLRDQDRHWVAELRAENENTCRDILSRIEMLMEAAA